MPDGSYPIKDQEDLDNAVHAVGRGNADHDTIRKHIIKQAHKLGHPEAIPDNWNTDGSLKQENALEAAVERASASLGRRGASERRKERQRAVPLGREVRFFAPTSLEVREVAATSDAGSVDEYVITGSPIMYGIPYIVVDFFGEFRETIHAGSVAPLIARRVDTRLLLNHDGLPMARTLSSTMRLMDTSTSLNFEAHLDARQQLANDFAIAIQRKDLTQMSVGMIVDNDKWDWDDADDIETRDIFGLNDLLDISGVTFACSPTTHIEVAQRMAMMVPMQTRARLRRMEVELRSGKVLSADSQSKLVAAISALHDLASAGGIDPASLIHEDEDEEPESQIPSHEDMTDAGEGEPNVESDAGIDYPDGSGSREADPQAELRRQPMTASTLRAMVEAGRRP